MSQSKNEKGSAVPLIVGAIATAGALAMIVGGGTQMVAKLAKEATTKDTSNIYLKQGAFALTSESSDIDGDGFSEGRAMAANSDGTGTCAGAGLTSTSTTACYVPSTSSAPKGDSWGSAIKYCSFDNGTTNSSAGRITGANPATGASIVFALVSAGPNKAYNTTCAQAAAGTAGGDDIIYQYSGLQVTQGVSGTQYWGDPVANKAALDALDPAQQKDGESRTQKDTGQVHRFDAGTNTWKPTNGVTAVNGTGVGIGMATLPAATLHVDKGSAGEALRIGGTGDQSISFGGGPSIASSGNAVDMILNASGQANQLVLKSSGRTLLGGAADNGIGVLQAKGGVNLQDAGGTDAIQLSPAGLSYLNTGNPLLVNTATALDGAVALQVNGAITANGTVKGGYLLPTVVAVLGQPCATQGVIAQSGSGASLSCVGGTWLSSGFWNLNAGNDQYNTNSSGAILVNTAINDGSGAKLQVNGDTSLAGNLLFNGAARRIYGDFSDATDANRLMFQSSVANGDSYVGVLPNGASTTSAWVAYNNANPAAAGAAILRATVAAAELTSTGALPITINPGGATVGTFSPGLFSVNGEITATGIAKFENAILLGYLTHSTAPEAKIDWNTQGSLRLMADPTSAYANSKILMYVDGASTPVGTLTSSGLDVAGMISATYAGIGSTAYTSSSTSAELYSTPGTYPGVASAGVAGYTLFNSSGIDGSFGSFMGIVKNSSGNNQVAGMSMISKPGIAQFAPDIAWWMRTGGNANTEYMRLSTAGLSVTGALSATGNATLLGKVGIGAAADSTAGLYIGTTTLTSAQQYGIISSPIFSAASTTSVAIAAIPKTAAAPFTLSSSIGVRAFDAIKGAGSTITSQYGFFADDQTQGTNNAGYASFVTAGAGKWNHYAAGTANNVFVGNVKIGALTVPTAALDVTGNAIISSAGTPHLSITSSDADPTGQASILFGTPTGSSSLGYYNGDMVFASWNDWRLHSIQYQALTISSIYNGGVGATLPAVSIGADGLLSANKGAVLNGNVRIGSAATDAHQVNGRLSVGGAGLAAYMFHVTTDATRTTIGGNAAWTNTSDARLKNNVASITNALDLIRNLRGVRYTWDQSKVPGWDTQTHIGFLAQEVEPYVPEIVHTDLDGRKAIEYSSLVAVLSQGVKELDLQVQRHEPIIERAGRAISTELDWTGNVISVTKGGTGLAFTPGVGDILIGNGTGYTLSRLTGTDNQIVVEHKTGGFQFSLPHNVQVHGKLFAESLSLLADSGAITNAAAIDNALAKLVRLKGSYGDINGARLPVFMADDMQAEMPELVDTTPNGLKTVGYTGVLPILVEAVKELHAKVGPLYPLAAKLSILEDGKNTIRIDAPVLVTGDFTAKTVTAEKVTAKEIQGTERVYSDGFESQLVGGGFADILDVPAQGAIVLNVSSPDGKSHLSASVINTGNTLKIATSMKDGFDIQAIGTKVRLVNTDIQTKNAKASWVRTQ